MRVLLVTQYFSPEITAAPLRLKPFAEGLARAGHDVTVLCQIPNHPEGRIPVDYQGKLLARERVAGYRVVHVRAFVSRTSRAASRLASYGTFFSGAGAVGAMLRRPDVVLASSPPLTVGMLGDALSLRFRAPFVLDVRDPWPEAAVALGEIEEGAILSAAEAIERRLYRRAAAVITPTEPFAREIRERGGKRVEIVANGTTEEWIDRGLRPPDQGATGVPDGRFVWCYGGNLGLSQDLETAIAAAEILGDGFTLLLLGDGTARPRLEAAAGEQILTGRVMFRDALPPEQASVVMRASDALLVSLADRPALARSVPVKLYDSSALGRPVIVAAPGEARRVAEEAGSALIVPPESPGDLAVAVRSLADDSKRAEELGEAARSFAQRNLRSGGVDELERILGDVAARRL